MLAPLERAHAGIFSFAEKIFGSAIKRRGEDKAFHESENSQNVALLQAALHSDPNPSKGGGEVTIVDGSALVAEIGPSGTMADIDNRSVVDKISVYVVREGDSLSQIARMFDVSVNTIIWANDIRSGSLIRTGQTLVILPVSGVRHVVSRGDTLSSIAKKYGGDVEEIIRYNGLTDGSVLAVGDTLVVPDGEISVSVYARSPSPETTGIMVGRAREGYYIMPVTGGRRTQGLHGYNAVDLGAYYGAPIFAAADGNVITSRDSGWNGGYGKYIVIAHPNGTQTLYAHNSRNIVYVGQKVVQGQVIGYVGSSGKSTGPHIHFEVRGAANPF